MCFAPAPARPAARCMQAPPNQASQTIGYSCQTGLNRLSRATAERPRHQTRSRVRRTKPALPARPRIGRATVTTRLGLERQRRCSAHTHTHTPTHPHTQPHTPTHPHTHPPQHTHTHTPSTRIRVAKSRLGMGRRMGGIWPKRPHANLYLK